MNKLTHVESSRIVSVLDEALDKIDMLSSLPIAAAASYAFAGEEIDAGAKRILKEQQRAEQFFEELLADRTALEVDVDSAAEQLREVTRSTARVLQTQPAIMDMVRRKSDQSEGTYRFCEYLRDLTKVTLLRLSTTVEQEQSRNDHLTQLKTKITNDEEQQAVLTEKLRKERAEKERDFQFHDDIITKLRAELQDIKSGNEQEANNLEQGTKATEDSHTALHMERATEQNTRISKLEEELGGMHKENQGEEEGLRKRKTKLMNEVKTCLNSYDAALTAKQDEIDEVRSLYEAEKKRLAELTEHFRRIDRNLARQAEEEAAWKAVHDKKVAEETKRLGGAASKIQAHWKGFTTRREMTTKKKGKGKKGGKKGKKGKKK